MYINVPCLRSAYLSRRVVSAGLGEQYDISEVREIEGAARYVAKYLFHPDMFKAKYPPGWKRIRYSQSFPNLPEMETDAFPLLARDDWALLAQKAVMLDCVGDVAYSEAQYHLRGSDVVTRKIREKQPTDKRAKMA